MADLYARGRFHMGRRLPELQALLARAEALAEEEQQARRERGEPA